MMNLSSLIRTARGSIPADLVYKNITMLMVSTGEWITGDLAVTGDRIVAAGPESYEGKRIIDGTGLFAVPGFIDAHLHVESCHVLPPAFESAVLPRGTTTAVCDPHELANVCGKEAIRFFLDCSENMQMDLRVQLSSCVPATPLETAGAELSAEDLKSFQDDPHVIGLAEFMNVPGVFFEVPPVLAKLEAFAGSVIDGHAPLLAGKDLNACLACGIGSDHECTSAEEAMEKIRRGMTLFIREGSVAKDLDRLAKVLTPATVDFVALCTDDRDMFDIEKEGHLDHMIRRLIAKGIAPELVYRAASRSAAQYFRMYDRGALNPGKLADIVILEDVKDCRIRQVVKAGKIVGQDAFPVYHPDTAFAMHSVRRKPVLPEELQVPSRKTETPVIGIRQDSLLTDFLTRELPLVNGIKMPLPEKDILKLCVIARHGKNDNIGKGFAEGFGLKQGAVASTVGHDSHNLCVIGCNDEDMAFAANTLIDCGGGFAVVCGGKVLALAPLPAGGLFSLKSMPEFAEEVRAVEQAIAGLGGNGHAPLMQLAFLVLPVIPHLKLTDKGLVDVQKFDFVEV